MAGENYRKHRQFTPINEDGTYISSTASNALWTEAVASTVRIGAVSGVVAVSATTKAIASTEPYAANDVVSENEAANSGTVWTFASVARAIGAGGYITGATIIAETTGITPRLLLHLYSSTAITCELDDNAANTSPVWADSVDYIGAIAFPAMEDVGGSAYTIATPSTVGNLPLVFKSGTITSIYGVLQTRDAFTNGVGKDINIALHIEQY